MLGDSTAISDTILIFFFKLTKRAHNNGNVVCPLKEHQKCSTDQKSKGQNGDPIKSYSQNTDFCHFCLGQINRKNQNRGSDWVRPPPPVRTKSETLGVFLPLP